MDAEQIKKKMRAGAFVENNGKVLRTINILRIKYVKLADVKYAHEDMPEHDLVDAINYLHGAGYITLRTIDTHKEATTGLADYDYEHLEGKVTPQGVALLAFRTEDPLIKV